MRTVTAEILRVDGTDEVVQLNSSHILSTLYEKLECSVIERVKLKDGLILLVDEEGALKSGRQTNDRATSMYWSTYGAASQPIFGNVAVMRSVDFK